MSTTSASYWEDLSQWFAFAAHQLVYIPACCIHAIEQELRAKHGSATLLHRPRPHSENHPLNQLEAAKSSQDHIKKAAIVSQPHFCRSCGDDIISRVHSTQGHHHSMVENRTFQDWLSNEQPRLELYQALPRVNEYERNLDGFSEEHLRRIEKYWTEHQLLSPNCTAKAAKLATADDWAMTKRQALKSSEVES